METRSQPDYYEGKLSQEAAEARERLEDRLSEAYKELETATGVTRLKLQETVNHYEQSLSWQGANPKKLPIDELKEHITAADPSYDSQTNVYRKRISNRATAIRAFCVSCMGGDVSYVRSCASITCPLHAFRMGKDPLRGYDLPKPTVVLLIETDEDDGPDYFEEGDDGDEKDAS